MRKTLLSVAFAALMLNANAQNLIPKGDFKNVTSIAENGQLLRIANLTDAQTQTTLPTFEATKIEKGEWYKKSGANGTLTSTLQQDITLADGTFGNGVLMKKVSGTQNENQNCLTTFMTLELNKEYVLSFDIKPTTTIEDYNDLIWVYLRAFTADNKLGKAAIGRKFLSTDFTAGQNGWYHFERTFNTNEFETSNSVFYVSVNGANFNYEYTISNVSLVEKTGTGIAGTTAESSKIYASGQNITIESTNGIAEIMDLTGRRITKATVNGTVVIPVAQSGIYLVSLTSEGNTTTKKLSVQ